MNCQICNEQPATIHTIDIVNNVKTDRHICEVCYKEQGLAQPFSIPNVADFIKLKTKDGKIEIEGLQEFVDNLPEGIDTATPVETIFCPNCGVTLEEFRKKGNVGCAVDYEVFAEEICRLAAKLHGAKGHKGRVPRAVEDERARKHQAAQLQDALAIAIAEENFEEAANLRDRINALESAGRVPTESHKESNGDA